MRINKENVYNHSIWLRVKRGGKVMFMEERQKDIVKKLNETGRVLVSELQERYGISADCARRDLRLLEGKGLLKEGWDADICIFDPANIRERGTYQDPCQYAGGMDYVLVAGRPAIAEGGFEDLESGQVLVRN